MKEKLNPVPLTQTEHKLTNHTVNPKYEFNLFYYEDVQSNAMRVRLDELVKIFVKKICRECIGS